MPNDKVHIRARNSSGDRNSRVIVAVALTTILIALGVFSGGGTRGPSRIAGVDTSDSTTSDLIDQLTTLDAFGIGYDPWSSGWISTWISGGIFLGSDGAADFDKDDLLPEFAPTIQELVARGAEALPELLAHLDDSRVTQIGVRTNWTFEERYDGRPDENRIWLAAWLDGGGDYDARYESGNSLKSLSCQDVNQHWVTVGDLCYVAIGQIVNRDFEVFQYGGENGGSIMSPTSCPELAKAVRQDWGGITRNQHRDSLINDTLYSRRDCFGIPRGK